MKDKVAPNLEGELSAVARDGRVACATALALAERLSVSPRVVGAACDRLGLKIVSCQLGCFGDSKTAPTEESP